MTLRSLWRLLVVRLHQSEQMLVGLGRGNGAAGLSGLQLRRARQMMAHPKVRRKFRNRRALKSYFRYCCDQFE